MTLTRRQQIEALEKDWATNPRWKNVKRTYTAAEVVDYVGLLHRLTLSPSVALINCGHWSTEALKKVMLTV